MDDLDFGPATEALDTKRRNFALAFIREPPCADAPMRAAIAAGYVEPGLRRQAAALLKDKGVLDALKELGQAEVLCMIPNALQAIRDIADTVHSKDRLKAAQLILDRFNPVVQKVEVKAEVVDRTQVTLDHLRHLIEIGAGRDALVREFGEFGLERYMKLLEQRKEPLVIEHEPVPDNVDDLL